MACSRRLNAVNLVLLLFFFQAEDGIRDVAVTGVQTCALPILEAAKAAIETAEINLDYCYIHSPIDGRAGARLVDVGNVVQANTTSLLSIQRIDPIYATFTITERDLAEVQQRMSRGTRSEEHTSELQSRLHLVC